MTATQRVIHGGRQQLPEHASRVEQARARAAWELGDPSWADLIIDVYCDPDADAAKLAADLAD